ncbi:MAG: hypothetical protein IJG38_15985 [Thermoguttaceae bacterium]|nr:hypothetical protein [Thermoguttaceae bacterium]
MKKNGNWEDSGRLLGEFWEALGTPNLSQKIPSSSQKIPNSSQSFFCGRGQPRSGCAMFVQVDLRNC